jgi:very-short-patch-repair endonuclease
MPPAKYNKIKKCCPYCQAEFETFDGGQNAREFCSRSCAMKSRTLSKETKKKVSDSLIAYFKENNTSPDYICKYELPIKNCLQCGQPFSVYNKKMKFCSKICSSKHHRHSEETKKKMRDAEIKLIQKGLHIGWTFLSRKNMEPSFPEKITIEILEKHNINYVREYKVHKWFIDFADIERKIAVEIDGKQHNLPVRKISDTNKDQYLVENGWKVFRIKWQKFTPEFYSYLENEIKSIFTEIK